MVSVSPRYSAATMPVKPATTQSSAQDEQLRAKARLEIAAAAFSIISSAPNHEAAAASIADAILGGVFPRVEVRI